MDGERKKRKKEDQARGNDNEDENVEKFFALIRSTREVKERLLSMASGTSNAADHPPRELQHDIGGKSKNLSEAVENVPTFAPEDFMKMEDRRHRPLPPPPDLNISLQSQSQSRAHGEAAEAEAGTSRRSKTADGGDDNGGGGDDDHGLDLKLSL